MEWSKHCRDFRSVEAWAGCVYLTGRHISDEFILGLAVFCLTTGPLTNFGWKCSCCVLTSFYNAFVTATLLCQIFVLGFCQ